MTSKTTHSLTSLIGEVSKGNTDPYVHYLSEALIKAVPDLYRDIAADIAAQSAGNLVRNISNDQERLLHRFTRRALIDGWTDDELADRLYRYINLDERSAQAVENFRQGLIKRGIPKGVARQRSYAYARKLRATRCRNIARTELARSVGAAKRRLWSEWRRDGLIDQYTVRIWHTSKKEVDCPTCRPMNGQRAAVDGLYMNGHVGPPLHPNCQCWESLDRGPVRVAKKDPRDGDGDGFIHDGTPQQRPVAPIRGGRAAARMKARAAGYMHHRSGKPRSTRFGDYMSRFTTGREDIQVFKDSLDFSDQLHAYRNADNLRRAKVVRGSLVLAREKVQEYGDALGLDYDDRFIDIPDFGYLFPDEPDYVKAGMAQRLRRLGGAGDYSTPLDSVNDVLDAVDAAIDYVDRFTGDKKSPKGLQPNWGTIAHSETIRPIVKWTGAIRVADAMELSVGRKKLFSMFYGMTPEEMRDEMKRSPDGWSDRDRRQNIFNHRAYLWAEGLMGMSASPAADPGFTLAAAKQDRWASTSSDNDAQAWQTQAAIAALMREKYPSTHDVEWQVGGSFSSDSKIGQGRNLYEEHKEFNDLWAETVYAATQAELGNGDVILFRGQNIDTSVEEPALIDGALNPASSWSNNYSVAQSFGEESGGLFMTVVPKEHIFGISELGFGCLNEDEYVISSHSGEIWWMPDSAVDFDSFATAKKVNLLVDMVEERMGGRPAPTATDWDIREMTRQWTEAMGWVRLTGSDESKLYRTLPRKRSQSEPEDPMREFLSKDQDIETLADFNAHMAVLTRMGQTNLSPLLNKAVEFEVANNFAHGDKEAFWAYMDENGLNFNGGESYAHAQIGRIAERFFGERGKTAYPWGEQFYRTVDSLAPEELGKPRRELIAWFLAQNIVEMESLKMAVGPIAINYNTTLNVPSADRNENNRIFQEWLDNMVNRLIDSTLKSLEGLDDPAPGMVMTEFYYQLAQRVVTMREEFNDLKDEVDW